MNSAHMAWSKAEPEASEWCGQRWRRLTSADIFKLNRPNCWCFFLLKQTKHAEHSRLCCSHWFCSQTHLLDPIQECAERAGRRARPSRGQNTTKCVGAADSTRFLSGTCFICFVWIYVRTSPECGTCRWITELLQHRLKLVSGSGQINEAKPFLSTSKL